MYGKAWAAVLYAVAIAVQAAGVDRHVSNVEWVQIGIAAATAVGVYLVPITASYKWIKTGVAMVLAVLQALATVLLGPHSGDWITILIATAGALLIWVAPATTVNPSGVGNVSVPVGADV